MLETFVRYARQQGMTAAEPDPADLFAPETLTSVIV